MQRFILEEVLKNDDLRNQILANNTNGVELFVNQSKPNWLNSFVRICNYEDICSLGFIVEGEIYADEVLVVTNITDYPSNALKLKLFFWEK